MGLNTFPCNPYPISTEELNKGNNDDLNARVATLEETVATLGTDVTDLNSNKANQIAIAPFFNAEVAYDPGDLVYYNGLSYRCVNAHEGEWDADDFAATTISNELDALKSGSIGHVFGSFTPTASSTRGDIATALYAIFSDLSPEDKRLCKIVRNDGFVFVASGVSGNFIATMIGDTQLNAQLYSIYLPAGKYLGWSSISTTEGEDMSNWPDVEGRTHYLVRG